MPAVPPRPRPPREAAGSGVYGHGGIEGGGPVWRVGAVSASAAALTAYVAVNAARTRSRRGLAALTGGAPRSVASYGPSLDARRSTAPPAAVRLGGTRRLRRRRHRGSGSRFAGADSVVYVDGGIE